MSVRSSIINQCEVLSLLPRDFLVIYILSRTCKFQLKINTVLLLDKLKYTLVFIYRHLGANAICMHTHNIFENVFEFCCENTVFMFQLAVAKNNRVLDISFARMLLSITNSRIHAATLKLMQLLYQQEPLRLTKTLSLYPIEVGTDFGEYIAKSLFLANTNSEIVPCFLHYIQKLVNTTPAYLPILKNLVYSIIISYDLAKCLNVFNIVGTNSVLDLCNQRDFFLSIHGPESIIMTAPTIQLRLLYRSITHEERIMNVASVNTDLLTILNKCITINPFLITLRMFSGFHGYIMRKKPHIVQQYNICQTYFKMAIHLLSTRTQSLLKKNKVCFVVTQSLLDFKHKIGSFSQPHLMDTEDVFDSVSTMVLRVNFYHPHRSIKHLQRLLHHVSSPANFTSQKKSLQMQCVGILRRCIILDSKRKQGFKQTISIISRLPPSPEFNLHYMLYSCVYSHILTSPNKHSSTIHGQNIMPLIFFITQCAHKQKCASTKKIALLLLKITGFVSCSIFLLGSNLSEYEDHKNLCSIIMSVQNISSGFNSTTNLPPTNFLHMFHYILKSISETQTIHAWNENELRTVTNFILRYLEIYHGTAHQFSQSNAFLIQKILSNTNLFFAKTRSLELRYLHILQYLSACYNFPTFTIQYLNHIVRQYHADFFVSNTVIFIMSKQLSLLTKTHTTSYLDVVMPKYISMLENIKYNNRNSLNLFTQITCWLHICIQLCLFHFRTQHTTDYNNARNVSIIDDAIITMLQLTIPHFHLVFSDVFTEILTLLNMWQINPGRKQSVTWLYFVFTIMSNALLANNIVQSAAVDANYITIVTKISLAFPMLSRNTHIDHVSMHVQNLLKVRENILNFGTMLSTYTRTSMLHNGYLCE